MLRNLKGQKLDLNLHGDKAILSDQVTFGNFGSVLLTVIQMQLCMIYNNTMITILPLMIFFGKINTKYHNIIILLYDKSLLTK